LDDLENIAIFEASAGFDQGWKVINCESIYMGGVSPN